MEQEQISCGHCNATLFQLPHLQQKSKQRVSVLVTCEACRNKNRVDLNADEWNAYNEAQAELQRQIWKQQNEEQKYAEEQVQNVAPEEVFFYRKK